MIPLLTRVSWMNLSRDRAAQVMVFVLPVAFFSIFAVIFGGRSGSSGTGRLPVIVVDESRTEKSRALVAALEADTSLRVLTKAKADTAALTRERAEAMVRGGVAAVALVLPAGIDTSLARFDGRGTKVLELADPSDPVAPRMAQGLLQKAVLTSTRAAGRAAASEFLGSGGSVSGAAEPPIDDLMPARTEVREVLGRKEEHSMVAFYAAGIAVMFMMFSASFAGGALIEETESGTLERVLSTGLGMGRLLGSKWLYVTLMGLAQLAVMFAWARLAFHLDVLAHLPGVIVMSVFTAMCTSAFGLVLATASRTRQQLQGLANIVILSLSAVGGSMFPRFLMSETLQKASLVGFNAWALDGFIKVFWREAPLPALLPQVAALAGFTLLFLLLARQLARRWETA
jgi:ABC-2 type transport system permease protein